MEDLVKFLFEVGNVERASCEDDIHELLAITRKIENKKGVYLGKKDQNTLNMIEEKYSQLQSWDGLSVAEKQVLASKINRLSDLLDLDLKGEVSKYQRGLNR